MDQKGEKKNHFDKESETACIGPMETSTPESLLKCTITAVFLYRDILDYTIDTVDG